MQDDLSHKIKDSSNPLLQANPFWGSHLLKMGDCHRFGMGKLQLFICAREGSIEMSVSKQAIPFQFPNVDYDTNQIPAVSSEKFKLDFPQHLKELDLLFVPCLAKPGFLFELNRPLLIPHHQKSHIVISLPLQIKVVCELYSSPLLELNTVSLPTAMDPISEQRFLFINDDFQVTPDLNSVLPHKALVEIVIKNETGKNLTLKEIYIDFTNAALFSNSQFYFTSSAEIVIKQDLGKTAQSIKWTNETRWSNGEYFLVQSSQK